jgi:hypothetical protein
MSLSSNSLLDSYMYSSYLKINLLLACYLIVTCVLKSHTLRVFESLTGLRCDFSMVFGCDIVSRPIRGILSDGLSNTQPAELHAKRWSQKLIEMNIWRGEMDG